MNQTLRELWSSAGAFAGDVHHAAEYAPQLVPEYQGNPYIEALPPLRDRNTAARLLRVAPPYDAKAAREAPRHVRKHMLGALLRFRQPLTAHLELDEKLGWLIRQGYVDRNPAHAGHHRRAVAIADRVGLSTAPVDARALGLGSYRASARVTGLTVIGVSGTGKTCVIESSLQTYPQVIVHSKYARCPLQLMQVSWLKLDCPHDGSVKGLCINFMQAMDALLGTNYRRAFAAHRVTVDTLLPDMARIAALHGLGVLVIDEVQHLSRARSGGAGLMLNFFVQLVNLIGVPVVLVGTANALNVIGTQFRQARRGATLGSRLWSRLKEDQEWELFLRAMWKFQYTCTPTPLTAALSSRLYIESQGIIDVAIKLYALAQLRAMERGSDVGEPITPSTIESVADDSLHQVRPVLQAIRDGNDAYLAALEDVLPRTLEALAHRVHASESALSVGSGVVVKGASRLGGVATERGADPKTRVPGAAWAPQAGHLARTSQGARTRRREHKRPKDGAVRDRDTAGAAAAREAQSSGPTPLSTLLARARKGRRRAAYEVFLEHGIIATWPLTPSGSNG